MTQSRSNEHPSQTPTLSDECLVLIEKGKTAARAGKKAEARHFFRAAVEITPDHPDALLWLAYLSGGGRSSLEYLVRVLDADPGNERARNAIRWARMREKPGAAVPIPPQPPGPTRRRKTPRRVLMGLLVVALGLVAGLAAGAFVLDVPAAEPTRAQISALPAGEGTGNGAGNEVRTSDTPPPGVQVVAVLVGATPLFSERPVLFPSPTSTATPTQTPTPTETPTPTQTPSPPPTLTPTRTPTPTVTPVPPTDTPVPTSAARATELPTAPIGSSFRWIDVDLTRQRLVAYEGETPVRTVTVSTGLPRTPTVTGRFKIYVKYRAAPMSGPGYYLAGVPFVMYFYRGYGLHGTYWHNRFGQPMSHGCVNLPTPEAEWLFNWSRVGTPVVVHH